jgi:hypothetical protein
MFKFFNKIRHQLLTENKFSKYLLYAIGEIALVIIGILIALSINNWNEQRKLKIYEQALLKDLHVEVSNNIEALELVILEHEKSYAAAQNINQLFEDREAFNLMSESSFAELFRQMNLNYTYDPNNGILNSIISSGQIKNISNKELKYLLASIKDKTIDAFEETMKIEEWRNNIMDLFTKHTYIFKEGKISGYSLKNLYDIPEFRFYNNGLFVSFRGSGLQEENDLKKAMEHILKLIESEIKE